MVRGKRVREPVYKRLKDTIIREIKNGTLQENDPILSERLLSEQFGISRISTRKALKELIAEGYLYTLPGKGTFVRGITSGLQRPRTRTQNLAYIFWGADQSIMKIPYFAHIVAGAEREARKHNYHLIISTFEPQVTLPNALPSILEQGKVDGAIIEGVFLDVYRQINQLLPVVIISNFLYRDLQKVEKIDDVDYVAPNNETATIKVVEYLHSLGHKNLGFVMGNPYHSSFQERLNGFYLGVRQFNLHTSPEWIICGSEDGTVDFTKLLHSSPKPSAIVTANDFIALDIINYCNKANIKIPEELSVVGFDDIESSAWSNPPLTTVRVLTQEMGKQSVRRLIEKINDPKSTPTNILIGTELVIRESCAKAKT